MRYGSSEHLPDTGHTDNKHGKQKGVLDGNDTFFVIPEFL